MGYLEKGDSWVSIAISGVSIAFGGVQALQDVSFQAEKGEIVGIIGPNGAGKTTLFNVITSFIKPSAGKVVLDGVDLVKLSAHKIASSGVSRTFQHIRLFANLSALENVVIGTHPVVKSKFIDAVIQGFSWKAEERKLRDIALSLLKEVDLVNRRDDVASSLSYGEQRRLEIARALAQNPKVLLLDEPSAGMNYEETEFLRELIKEIARKRGVTVLLIAHDINLVMNVCKRIVVLNFGKNIALGSPDEIKDNQQVIEAYLGKEEEE